MSKSYYQSKNNKYPNLMPLCDARPKIPSHEVWSRLRRDCHACVSCVGRAASACHIFSFDLIAGWVCFRVYSQSSMAD
jgi:hypothetical protein